MSTSYEAAMSCSFSVAGAPSERCCLFAVKWKRCIHCYNWWERQEHHLVADWEAGGISCQTCYVVWKLLQVFVIILLICIELGSTAADSELSNRGYCREERLHLLPQGFWWKHDYTLTAEIQRQSVFSYWMANLADKSFTCLCSSWSPTSLLLCCLYMLMQHILYNCLNVMWYSYLCIFKCNPSLVLKCLCYAL